MTTKRFPRTGKEALQAMLDARYSLTEIVSNLKEHASVEISLPMLSLVNSGKRTMSEKVSSALVKTAKALNVRVEA